MNTYRWFKIGSISGSVGWPDLSLLTISSHDDEWFEIERAAEEFVEARFYHKVTLDYDQASPGGGVDVNTLECVKSVLFKITTRQGLSAIRVQDNMRGVTALLAAIARKLGFGFYIEAIGFQAALDHFAVHGWGSFSSFDSAKIIGAKVSGADPLAGIVGRFEFSSKAGFEISDIASRLPQEFKLQSVKLELTKAGASGALSFSSIGRCAISGRLSSYILEDIESRLIYGS
jgi:hypothetical protein